MNFKNHACGLGTHTEWEAFEFHFLKKKKKRIKKKQNEK